MKIAICDDREEDRILIHKLIKKHEGLERFVIEEFKDGVDLIEAYHKGARYHLVCLDIQMQKMDGLDTADLIREVDNNVIIAFITSLPEYFSNALFFEASAYLVKPIKEVAIEKVLIHAIKRWKLNTESQIVLQVKKELRYIRPFVTSDQMKYCI